MEQVRHFRRQLVRFLTISRNHRVTKPHHTAAVADHTLLARRCRPLRLSQVALTSQPN